MNVFIPGGGGEGSAPGVGINKLLGWPPRYTVNIVTTLGQLIYWSDVYLYLSVPAGL